MKSLIKFFGVLTVSCAAQASTPPILLEACNLFDDPSKRLECLRAANGHTTTPVSSTARQTSKSTPASLASFDQPTSQPSSTRAAPQSRGSATCHVGPRGGTYTITASGRKNYGGC